jgi:hypothetical protein
LASGIVRTRPSDPEIARSANRSCVKKLFSDLDEDVVMGTSDTLRLQVSLICLLLFLNGMTVLAQHPQWFQ